jgi:hypothetical protein
MTAMQTPANPDQVEIVPACDASWEADIPRNALVKAALTSGFVRVTLTL